MAELYVLDLRPWMDGGWRALLPELPPERRQRALACRFDADSARAAGAGWLLQYALEQAGIPQAAQVFTQNPWGKPLLANRDGPHFSLSHSGPWAVCAVGGAPLGVDVEPPRCTMAVARRHFHPREVEALERLNPQARQDALCRLWTGKEAFVKALGRGLTLPLDRFCITLEPAAAFLDQSHTPLPYRLHEYRLEPYRVCLCTTEDKPEIRTVSAAKLKHAESDRFCL